MQQVFEIASSRRVGAAGTKPTVIALHCSGSSGRQWNKLASALGDRCTLIAPDHMSCGATRPSSGNHRFCLADEAAGILDIVDAQDGAVHLVGHSYGGGVALRVARERLERIASLSLYEPTAFHVLRSTNADGRAALQQILSVASGVSRDVTAGNHQAAARRFVDYWNGEGTWTGMKPESQAELVRYIPKAPLEFSALIEEPAPLAVFRRMTFPVLLMRGALAPEPTALIVQKLFSIMPDAVIEEISNAGHMGPFSHAELVSDMIATHVLRAAGLDRLADRDTSARMPVAM
jgi:pimeloyl-ACP methyl ester carboxylesterase